MRPELVLRFLDNFFGQLFQNSVIIKAQGAYYDSWEGA
jgi:hypothetical protein